MIHPERYRNFANLFRGTDDPGYAPVDRQKAKARLHAAERFSMGRELGQNLDIVTTNPRLWTAALDDEIRNFLAVDAVCDYFDITDHKPVIGKSLSDAAINGIFTVHSIGAEADKGKRLFMRPRELAFTDRIFVLVEVEPDYSWVYLRGWIEVSKVLSDLAADPLTYPWFERNSDNPVRGADQAQLTAFPPVHLLSPAS